MMSSKKLSQDPESLIVAEYYFTVVDGVQGAHLRKNDTKDFVPVSESLCCHAICVLALNSRHTITGDAAFTSVSNFDEAEAYAAARSRALKNLGQFVDYAKRKKIKSRLVAKESV